MDFKFLKEFWHVMKGDIMTFMDNFHRFDILNKGAKASFITVTSKCNDPQGLGDFRPISLVRCMYKVITKLLASRLQKALHKVIDQRQSAFLSGRNILHSVLIANEVMDKARRKNRNCTTFKVDFEKVYDLVCWDFLLYVMGQLGFDAQWIKWIHGCLISSSVSILVNGSPTKEFMLERWLRQGDPLTPFLFLIVVEGLSGLMRETTLRNMFLGYKVGASDVEVNLLQYTVWRYEPK